MRLKPAVLFCSLCALNLSAAQNDWDLEPSEAAPPAPPAGVTGSLNIASSPAGASLFVNDSARGKTPLRLDGLLPGRYRLRLELRGYDPVTDNVQVNAGGMEERNYTLKTPFVVLPQVKTPKKHLRSWPTITLGTGAIVAVGAGYLLDRYVKKESDKCYAVAAQYAGSGTNDAYAAYRQEYHDHYNSAKNYSLCRNVLYVAAGMFSAGFAVSFGF